MLLQPADERLIKIVETLIFADDWITIAALSRETRIVERTCHADLKKIRTNWGKLLLIETSNKLGIRVQNHSTAIFTSICMDIVRETIVFRILEVIVARPRQTAQYYADRLDISVSSLLRQIKRINQQSAKHGHFTISRRQSQYQLEGDEIYIRVAAAGLSVLFCETTYLTKLLDSSDQLLRQILAADLDMIPAGGQDLWSRLMIMALHVALKREQAGFHAVQLLKKQPATCYRLPPQRVQDLRRLYPGVTPAAITNITAFLRSFGQSAFDPAALAIINEGIQNLCNQLNGGIPFVIPADLLPIIRQRFYKFISLNIHTPNREDSLFTRLGKYTQIFAREEPEAYVAIKQALKDFEVNTGYPLSDLTDEVIRFLLTYLPELCHKTVDLQVIILGDFGLESEQFLAHYFTSVFNMTDRVRLHVHCYAKNRPPQKLALEQADLFLTTDLKPAVLHPHTILVEDYPSEKTLQVIRQEIQLIRREKALPEAAAQTGAYPGQPRPKGEIRHYEA
ncbi:hypothetical protein HCH52_00275 [Oscillospiraceae bacterium HV4-5-C5C]|nr:hypothetical protein [Oscillospiraceae bacterium HV4-5-C5C]